jgi:ABC-type molybdenum transport system ATPase subunit/photorepair protein PhrA
MSNQYEVLGKAPVAEDLKNLSPNDVHFTIKNLNAGYGKMEILHNFELFVSKAQSLCLIGPNGAGKINNTSFNLWIYKYFFWKNRNRWKRNYKSFTC